METVEHSRQPAIDLLPRGGALGGSHQGFLGNYPLETHLLTVRLLAPDLEETHVLGTLYLANQMNT